MNIKDLKFMPEFFDRYIHLVDPALDLLDELANTKGEYEAIKPMLLAHENYRYAPNKWTPKEVLQHVIDNERIQSYRALAFSRKETAVLPGYDEQLYADNVNERSLDSLLEEFKVVRAGTILLFQSISDEQMHYEGICFNVRITPLALGFQIIGHSAHHLNTLKERYFS